MLSSYTALHPTQRSLACHSTPKKHLGLAARPLRHLAGCTSACRFSRSSVFGDWSETALPMLLAGSVIVNTLAVPLLLLPQPAAASAAVLQAAETPGAAQRALLAPPVQAEADEQQQQQQWWQQDQQVWQELTSPSELTAYLNSSQPPPAWPAVDSTALAPKLRLVEFYATWCPACKAAAPGMAEVAADPYLRQHCSFARINIDRAKPLVRQLGISKIPTVLLLAPDGSTLNNFRASGQAARDAITQQLAAMQQQQQQQQPSLPVLPPESAAGGDQEQPAPSEVEGNGSSTAGATCGTAPEPTCGQLPPGVALPDSSAAMPDTNSSSPGVLSAAPGSNADSQPGNSSSSSAVPADPALAAAKAQFLQQYGSGYGYAGGWLDQHYQGEVGSRLGPNKHYLDYTGAALYPASLLEAVYKDLLTHSYGNPHSVGAPAAADSTVGSSSAGSSSGAVAAAAVAAPPAAASEAVMEAAAAAVLQHLHADPAEYQVVFTRSATEALKLVGEMFPWSGGSSGSSSSMMQQEPGPRSELDMLSGTLRPQQPQQQLAAGRGDSLPADDGTNSSSSGSGSSSGGKSSSTGSKFVYTRTNHNSVLGIGAYAAAAGAELLPQTDDGMEAWVASLEQQQQQQDSTAGSAPTYNLLAYPAEDNYAGVLYPLQWINRVHAASHSGAQRTLVLLDAAAYLPTHELDLTAHPADFVVASFYKMFGYPTGLGALVLRTEHVPQLNKVYFGGGSVALATPEGCWHVSKCDPAAALSDGTPNYLGAAALKLAYESWDSRGGMQAVEQHTQALSSWLFDQLSALRHSNGAPLIQLYGRHGLQGSVTQQGSAEAAAAGFSQGAVFNFQVLQPDGQPVSFSKVDRDATAAGLYLRSGCVCNPGACYDSLGLEAAEVQQLAGLKEGCGDEMDFITVPRPARESAAAAPAADSSSSRAGLWWRWRGASSSSGASGSGSGSAQQQEVGSGGGSSPQEGDLVPTQVPLGSVRASLGWASTFEDVYALVQFLRGYLS